MTPPQWRKATVGLLIGLAGFLGVYDLAAYALGGNEATVSVVLRDAGRDNPIIVFLMGLAAGHWWWAQARRTEPTKVTVTTDQPATTIVEVDHTRGDGTPMDIEAVMDARDEAVHRKVPAPD